MGNVCKNISQQLSPLILPLSSLKTIDAHFPQISNPALYANVARWIRFFKKCTKVEAIDELDLDEAF